MIVKVVGRKLLGLRVHELARRVAPVFIIACLYMLFLLPLQSTQLQYQQPTLHPKIFQLKKVKPSVFSHYQFIKYLQVPGRTSNEALLLAFNPGSPLSQSIAAKVASEMEVLYPSGPTKTILVVGFQPNQTSKFLQLYHNGRLPFHSGTIRLAIYLDLSQSSMMFFKMFQGQGLIPDGDYFFAMENLLKRVDLPFFFCDEGRARMLKTVASTWQKALKYAGYKARTADIKRFLQGMACQYHANKHDPSFILMKHGIMSSTLQGGNSTQKLTKLITSFLSSLSFAQDHLHSSWTLYFPLYESIITIDKYIMPFVMAIVAIAYPIIYSYYANPEMYTEISRLTPGCVGLAGYVGLVVGGYYLAGVIAGVVGIGIYGRMGEGLKQGQYNFYVLIHKVMFLLAMVIFMIVRVPYAVLALLYNAILHILPTRIAGILLVLFSGLELVTSGFSLEDCSGLLAALSVSTCLIY